MIDTHTHIYLPAFQDDLPGVMSRAEAVGVKSFLLPAIDASTHARMLEVEAAYPSCRCMMGLHPCSVGEGYETELALVAEYLEQLRFVAVGEIGLDFYWDKTFTSQQYAAFHRQIGLAEEHGLPIVIHSREAIDECITVVEEYPGLKGVFHCFTGNRDQAERAMRTGFYLGIGGVVTFKNSGLDKVVEAIGLDRLMLETDAPYLAPVPYRGKRNEPSYLEQVVEKLSLISGKTKAEVIELTSENAVKLFGL